MEETLPLDPLNLGRALYKKRNYIEALTAFTVAVEEHTGFMELQALDHRAATYEKLGDFDKALKDGKSMIQLMPESSKGYLRCGKVLQLKNDAERALKIYERGLMKVKIGKDDDRILLQGMFSRIQRKLSPPEPRYCDPLVKLPMELAQLVVSHIGMRDRVVCLCVSKPWKRFLESSHDLWKELDLFRIRKQFNLRSLKAHCRRSNYNLTTAKINVAYFESSKLDYLLRKCKQLSCLEFRQGYLGESLTKALPYATNLKALRLWSDLEIPLQFVVKILEARPELEVAEFHRIQSGSFTLFSMPRLEALNCLILGSSQSLHIHEARQMNILSLPELIECTPNLTRATIQGWKVRILGGHRLQEWTKLEYLDVSQSRDINLRYLPSSLRHLNCSGAKIYCVNPTDTEANIPEHCKLPLLESLNCENVLSYDFQDGSDGCIESLCNPPMSSGNLKSLNLGGCQGHFEDDENPQLSSCDSLIELSLEDWDFRESKLAEVVRKYPNLRRLNLSATKVTGVLVKEVMTREVGPLEFLKLVNATKISPDAIEWTRGLGTTVQTSSEVIRGKKNFRDRIWE